MMAASLYVLTDRVTDGRAVVRYPGLGLDGDPSLCRRLRPFLKDPVRVVGGRRDPSTGRRMTVLSTLVPGSLEWLEACLTRAAEDLRLDLESGWE
ncbi:MAG: hypothetical protein ACYCYK_01830 [Candidatus Dormibacteria bacterium]